MFNHFFFNENSCINKYMKNKIRVLVTHQIHYLTEANKIILLDDGKIKAQGSYDEIVNSGIDMNQMFDELETEKNEKKRLQTVSESAANDSRLINSPRPSISYETKPSNITEAADLESLIGSTWNMNLELSPERRESVRFLNSNFY